MPLFWDLFLQIFLPFKCSFWYPHLRIPWVLLLDHLILYLDLVQFILNLLQINLIYCLICSLAFPWLLLLLPYIISLPHYLFETLCRAFLLFRLGITILTSLRCLILNHLFLKLLHRLFIRPSWECFNWTFVGWCSLWTIDHWARFTWFLWWIMGSTILEVSICNKLISFHCFILRFVDFRFWGSMRVLMFGRLGVLSSTWFCSLFNSFLWHLCCILEPLSWSLWCQFLFLSGMFLSWYLTTLAWTRARPCNKFLFNRFLRYLLELLPQKFLQNNSTKESS